MYPLHSYEVCVGVCSACCVTPAVTFVALGNGAPDLSANIAAISAGEVVLSAGAFTGAAMFVQVGTAGTRTEPATEPPALCSSMRPSWSSSSCLIHMGLQWHAGCSGHLSVTVTLSNVEVPWWYGAAVFTE